MGPVYEPLEVVSGCGMVAAEVTVASSSWRKRWGIEAGEVVQDRCLIACAMGGPVG